MPVTVVTLGMVPSSISVQYNGHIRNGTFNVTSYVIIADISNLNTTNITTDIASAYITASAVIDFNSGNIIVTQAISLT